MKKRKNGWQILAALLFVVLVFNYFVEIRVKKPVVAPPAVATTQPYNSTLEFKNPTTATLHLRHQVTGESYTVEPGQTTYIPIVIPAGIEDIRLDTWDEKGKPTGTLVIGRDGRGYKIPPSR